MACWTCPPPGPADAHAGDNAYVYERRVSFAHGDGSQSFGFVDCYKRGAFVLEAKKSKLGAHTVVGTPPSKEYANRRGSLNFTPLVPSPISHWPAAAVR